MPSILQINSVLNYGSTGKIVEQIAETVSLHNWDCLVAHGVKYLRPSSQKSFIVGNKWDVLKHEAASLLLDRHGLASQRATMDLIEKMKEYKPDVIHLHNIHNYYLYYPVLFDYLANISVPVVWTLHDCWSFTGHCSYFDAIGCNLWRTGCGHCPGLKIYPRSLLVDRSEKNYIIKKKSFTAISDRLTIVPVSFWLEGLVKQSFLRGAKVQTIHNGIDINTFQPTDKGKLRSKLGIGDKFVVLGVALPWTPRKGLSDIFKLAEILPADEYQVVAIGLSEKQIQQCPDNMIGIKRTNSAIELAEYYSLADVFVNTTYEDNYPTTNLEAMACGTPVLTYRTGGSPEAVTSKTGWVVEKGNVGSMVEIIKNLRKRNNNEIIKQRNECRKRAEEHFDKKLCFEKYFSLYADLIV